MKYIIVTGTSRGLGAAIVGCALDEGYTVIAVSRTAPTGTKGDGASASPTGTNGDGARASGRSSGRFFAVTADLSDPAMGTEGYESVFARIKEHIDTGVATSVTLVNNAATLEPIGLSGSGEVDLAALPSVLAVNVNAPIALTDRFVAGFGPVSALPAGVQRLVINISSGAATRVMPGLATYSASKAAINAFTRSAAEEVRYLVERRGYAPVTLVAISPGVVETGMQATLRSHDVDTLPERDMYQRWRDEGTLKSADETARQIVALIDRNDLPSGQFLHLNRLDEEVQG
ncbi:MAG: SDR family NAD(P)-dependent oxidoreductase [Alkalispirochaeta sp.]